MGGDEVCGCLLLHASGWMPGELIGCLHQSFNMHLC